jgi:putative MATE family efflux protein
MINDLTEGNLTRQLIIFSIPFMLSNLLQGLYSVVDMVIVGRFVGSVGLSSVSIGSQLIMFFTWLGMGFSTSGQVMIGQYVGMKDKEGIRRTIGTLFSMLIIGAVALGLIGAGLTNQLLHAMNTPDEAFDGAVSYLRICCAGMLFIFGYNAVSSVLRGMGESQRPLIFVAIAAGLNLVLDLVFVAGMDLGAAGAALATVIGQAVSFIISVIYLYRRREQFGFDFALRSFKMHGKTAANLTRLGAPMALQSAAISLSCLFTNSLVNAYGVAASAITGVGAKIMDLTGIVTRALSNAGATVVAQNVAAKKFDRVKKFVRVALVLCIVTMGVFALILGLFPKQVFGLFDSDPETLALAPAYAMTLIVGLGANALMSPYYAVINGIGYASLSFIIGILDGVVGRIGLSVLLGLVCGFGLTGFWIGSQLAGYITAICSAAYYYSGRWKSRELLIQK